MTTYLHGVEKIARRLFTPETEMVPLRMTHLPRLGPEDVIVTPRPWSPIFEAMLKGRPARRPFIVQTADGVAFPLNARKGVNMRYGGMQRFIFADVFLALQNAGDFEAFSDEPGLVRSNTVIETAPARACVDGQTAILVSGNDPFFDFAPEAVTEAFVATAERLRALGVTELLLSCPDARLRAALTARLPELRVIGRIIDYDGDLTRTLLVGSPSTVLLDHACRGGTCLLIDHYADPVLNGYMSTDAVLKHTRRTPEGLAFEALAVQSCEQVPFNLDQLLNTLKIERPATKGRRPPLPPEARNLFRQLSARLVLRDTHLLLGGHGRA